MSSLSKKQLAEYARTLYIKDSLTQKEIAMKVGVTEATIRAWKEKGKWDDLRAIHTISKPEMIRAWYGQINEINTAISSREEGKRYANSKEGDTLLKLAQAIKSLESELGISDLVDSFTQLIDWVKPQDLSKAKELGELIDAFIKSRI